MERRIVKITTPKTKSIIELKEWINGGEYRDIKNIVLKEMKIQSIGNETKIGTMTGGFIEIVENLELETVVVSINDKKENILKEILELPTQDYIYIKDEVHKIVDAGNIEK